jgi:hypothetical protein
MKTRYRITRRGSRGDTLYCVDSQTGKRTSLHTADEDAAQEIVDAKNQAERQPALNLQIAKVYMAMSPESSRGSSFPKVGCWDTAKSDSVGLTPTGNIEFPNRSVWRRLKCDEIWLGVF